MSEENNWQTAKEYKSVKAALLASIASISRDLEFTINATSQILQSSLTDMDKRSTDSQVIKTSLLNSAIVAYARCFNSGVRKKKLTINDFRELGDKFENAKRAHQYFLDLRDKHIAHSVNRFEDTKILVLVGDGVQNEKSGSWRWALFDLESGRKA